MDLSELADQEIGAVGRRYAASVAGKPCQVGRQYHRVLVAAADLADFWPPRGWHVHGVGPAYGPVPRGTVCMTLSRPMPLAPGPRTVLACAAALMMRDNDSIGLKHLAAALFVPEHQVREWLLQSRLADPEDRTRHSPKPVFAFAAGRIFWLTREGQSSRWVLHSKRHDPQRRRDHYYDNEEPPPYDDEIL